MNIYVGNLPYSTSEADLKKEFSECGEVTSVHIITDRTTGKSKGFGFIDMSNDQEAEKAIEQLDGKMVNSRKIRVNKARPRNQRR